jgi:hypothetical protein
LEVGRVEVWTEVGWFDTRVRKRWVTRCMEARARTGGSGRWWTPSKQGSCADRDRRVGVQEFQCGLRGEKARNLYCRLAKTTEKR